jgi:tocopherol O-methyltransferase
MPTTMSNSEKRFSKKDVSRYYDLSEVHYKMFWNLDKSKSLHYGYWDENTKTFDEALLNVNRELARRGNFTKDDVILDAGCGVGGTAIWFSKNIGCKTTGISINERQIRRANEFAKAEGVDHLTKFEVNDWTNTGYPDGSFSAITGIETICYANEKSDFLNEAARILKPRGRLQIVDFFKRPGLTGKDAKILQGMANGWAINDYDTQAEFEQKLRDCGFTNIRITNETKAIMPSVRRLYRMYFLGFIPSKLYNLFNPNTTELAKRNVDTAKLQYSVVKRQLADYLFIYAEKA